MWCGQAPDAVALASCCIFTGAIVAWFVAALGALAHSAGNRNRAATPDVLAIGFIAGMLIVAVHVAPPEIAALLTLVVAAHALLMAGMGALTHRKRPGLLPDWSSM